MESTFQEWFRTRTRRVRGKFERLNNEVGTLTVIPNPLEWIEKSINLADDKTASSNDYIKLDPWQIKPFKAQFDDNVRMVVIVAVEQIGKSTLWRLPLAYKMRFSPGPSWVIYESDDKAQKINKRAFGPLLRSIPDIAKYMNRLTARADGYDLANGASSDFSGAGADITSKPVKDGVADELDRWGTYDFCQQNLRNFRKRFRTFKKLKQDKLVLCSSPKTEGGNRSAIFTIYEEETDQAFWTLRCLKCGGHTMRSCDIHNLQFESESGFCIPDSIRLVCPKCKNEHEEHQAFEMNSFENADYISKNPEIIVNRGFQIGTLGVPRVFTWEDIANAQLKAGNSGGIGAQVDFDNSWRGLPFQKRKNNDHNVRNIIKRITEEKPETIKYRLFSADTQDNGWYWIIREYDENENSYLHSHGFSINENELVAAWNSVHCLAGIIDEGGHRKKDVDDITKDLKGVFRYKGNSRISARFKISEEDKKLILANPRIYQAEILYYIYDDKQRQSHNWNLFKGTDKSYIEQIASMKPDNKVKHGNDYENWISDGNDHYFDCEKMILVLKEHVDKVKKKSNKKPIKAQIFKQGA